MPERAGVAVVGGGLMGREIAAAIARWPALEDHPVRPELVVACDTDPERRDWFERVAGVDTTPAYADVLARDDVDVVYVALPHLLHEGVYADVGASSKALFGEKPFGIDVAACRRIVDSLDPGAFARCSSEMPFFPGAQLAIGLAQSGRLGRLVEARCAFLHSSDLDLRKPINWKRQVASCGPGGVLADLGMHVAHVPLRLGWSVETVSAVLQDIVAERPDGRGGTARCDTFENGTLLCRASAAGGTFPLLLETKRIAPGEMNTWQLEIRGLDGSVSFSTRYPQTVRVGGIDADGRQAWSEVQPGNRSVFPTVTGAIFEFGFSDAVLQMWAAFLAEWAGELDGRFGCATPAEALAAQELFDAALRSHTSGRAEPLAPA